MVRAVIDEGRDAQLGTDDLGKVAAGINRQVVILPPGSTMRRRKFEAL